MDFKDTHYRVCKQCATYYFFQFKMHMKKTM